MTAMGEGCHGLTQVVARSGGRKGRPLLADSAYDYHLAYRLAKERGFRPVIKRKEMEGSQELERREMVESFDPDLYRLRKVAEVSLGIGSSMFRSVPFS